jgi:uncharacterized phage-associated protein
MEFQTLTHKLVARICTHCRAQDIPLGQVRTTKLVYLVECEYAGWESKRLTDLDWRFWHYGPWSPTLDKVLKDDFREPAEEETETGKLVPVHWHPPTFDPPSLKIRDVTAEGVLLRVLERFAAMPYAELLDYVYFETWPMRDAVKGQDLDFSGIPKPRRFVDPISKLPPRVFYELRERFAGLEEGFGVAGPDRDRDLDLLRLLAGMDEGSEFDLPAGELLIDDATKARLRTLAED